MMALVLWASLAMVVYTYAGYPMLLWLWAKWRPRPMQRGDAQPDVVMIIVGHNEAHRIEAKIHTCLNQAYPAERLRVLVVSDGSTDATDAIVAGHPDPRVSLVRGPVRRGKAACLNDGVKASTAPIIVFTDARQRLHPEAVARLVASLADPAVGAVSGELVFENDDGTPFSQGMGAYWAYEKFIRAREAATGSVVGVTGALYAIRRACFEPIAHDTILDDVAIPMAAALQGWRIGFETGAIAYDRPSLDAAQEKVRKVRTLAGNFQLVNLNRRLLSPWANPLWWRFMSHKMLRLAVPLLLLMALGAHTTLALRGPGFYLHSWYVHVAGYALLGLALRFPALQQAAPIKLGVTFAHLNLFVVLGFVSFVKGKQSHLWDQSATAHHKK